jgi:bis(5'-nucleosyl)-tetraphosphatase (symmetrical)
VAVYAIGDVQGCFDELQVLLAKLQFGPDDNLWFTGDLVNRGPKSLETLRLVKGLGARAITVLGNHDLHLLAVAQGCERYKREDTFEDVVNAPDRDELLEWLRARPLLHHDAVLGFTLIHAGLPPQWDLQQARACAHEVEMVLRGAHHADFLRAMYGGEPRQWSEALTGRERLRFITNCLTRLRYCNAHGVLALQEKGAPGTQPEGYMPWFEVPGRRSADLKIIFGHWATLGAYPVARVFPLDGGCVWGGGLLAMRLDDARGEQVRLPCRAHQKFD